MPGHSSFHLVRVSYFWHITRIPMWMDNVTGVRACYDVLMLAVAGLMSASLPNSGILSGVHSPHGNQGKEADPWNLPPRSSTCYSISFLSSQPRLSRPSWKSPQAGCFHTVIVT